MGAAHSNALQRDAKYRGSRRVQEMINMVSLYVVMFVVVDDVDAVDAVLENACCTVASMLLYTEDSHQGSVALFDDDVIVVDVVGLRGRMNGVLCCFGSIVVS